MGTTYDSATGTSVLGLEAELEEGRRDKRRMHWTTRLSWYDKLLRKYVEWVVRKSTMSTQRRSTKAFVLVLFIRLMWGLLGGWITTIASADRSSLFP